MTLMVEQKKDTQLAKIFKWVTESKRLGTPPHEDFRVAPDGLLEKQVSTTRPGSSVAWVPVIPDGQASSHMTWKRFIYTNCHCGIAGAHRSAEKTYILAARMCWWKGMRQDIEEWTKRCTTCISFRKIAHKTCSPDAIPVTAECWQEVVVDLEGPSNPPDKDGNKFVMTYICSVCQGILLEPAKACNAMECRRMFAKCIMRSGTVPIMVRSDRGPEFKNVLQKEYAKAT